MHPVEELRGSTSRLLHRRRILFGVTGSIAAVESVRLARELIRHGADVFPVMTPAATRILHPDALEFATGHRPVTQLSGQVEHVQWCGLIPDPVNLVVLPGCTANTISKIAHGIDDTPVTTCVTTALGSQVPVLIIPAMHKSMYTNRFVQESLHACEKAGITILEPWMDRTKAKLADLPVMVSTIIRLLSPQTLAGKRILVIGGATAETIDDIRVLTNRSSGKMATSLAVAAYEQGAAVDLWYGNVTEPIPSFVSVTPFTTTQNLLTLVRRRPVKTYDGIIVCAAIANYIPTRTKGKIPSGKKELTITCHPAPKILEALRAKAPAVPIVAFKAEETKSQLHRETKRLIKTFKLQGAVGNTLASFGADTTEILILPRTGKAVWITGKKPELARDIINRFASLF